MRAAPAVDDFAARLAYERHYDETARVAEHSGGEAEQFPSPQLAKYTSTGQSDSFHAEPAEPLFENAPAK